MMPFLPLARELLPMHFCGQYRDSDGRNPAARVVLKRENAATKRLPLHPAVFRRAGSNTSDSGSL